MPKSATVIRHHAATDDQPDAAANDQPDAAANPVIEMLGSLIAACADSAHGFAACGDHSNISRHRFLFRQRAQECEAAGYQLHAMVLRLGGHPVRGGSGSRTLHRGWIALRGKLRGLRDASILAECERGEAVALALYRSALEYDLPPEVRALVQRQCDGIKLNLGQIHMLRESERAAA